MALRKHGTIDVQNVQHTNLENLKYETSKELVSNSLISVIFLPTQSTSDVVCWCSVSVECGKDEIPLVNPRMGGRIETTLFM